MKFNSAMTLVSLIFATHLVSYSAHAQESFWACDLMADLNGIPSSFLYYNKDSWEGRGELRCTNSGQVIDEEIKIQYEGWASATGIAGKAKLMLFSYFIPTDHPDEIFKNFPTTSMNHIPTYYNFPVTTVLQVGRNHPFEMAVQASHQNENIQVPLNFGTLSISKIKKP